MAFRISAGILLPANSILVNILLVCNISTIALPPNNPTLFHRKSTMELNICSYENKLFIYKSLIHQNFHTLHCINLKERICYIVDVVFEVQYLTSLQQLWSYSDNINIAEKIFTPIPLWNALILWH